MTTILTVGIDHQSQQATSSQESAASTDRLDRWLADNLPDHSRSAIQRWIKEGRVLINGQPARANQRLSVGDQVSLDIPQSPVPTALQAQDIPIDILYEDADVIVVNKPTGLVVHPAPGHAEGTLVNAILHHVPDLEGIGGEIRPGIVHRLDKDTSGVMVVAKHDHALRNLQEQFKDRKVEKNYIALVEGKISEDHGRIIGPVGRDQRDRKRMAVILGEKNSNRTARPAVTEFKVLARYSIPLNNDLGKGTFTLVQAHPITGRTHQIRVHFAWQGHPLVGDPIYGLKRQRLSLPRLFLHAVKLTFRLPSTGEMMEFSAPLPLELTAVIEEIEKSAQT